MRSLRRRLVDWELNQTDLSDEPYILVTTSLSAAWTRRVLQVLFPSLGRSGISPGWRVVCAVATDRRKPFAVPFFVLWCYRVWRQDVRLGDPGSCSKSTDMPGHSLRCPRHSPANIGPGVPFTISALNWRCRSCQYIVLLLTDGTQI